MINRVGRFNYNAHTHSLPRLRLNALMGLRIGDIRYSINARYLDSYENQRPLPESAVNNGYTNNVVIAKWISSGQLDVNWSIKIDQLSAVMLVVVTFVSSIVHIYSN